MSAIGGLLAPDGDDEGLAERLRPLACGLARRGPDGCAVRVVDRVAMIHRPDHTSPESRRRLQPVARGPLLVAIDGRLDNRNELVRSTGPGEAAPGETAPGDAELAAAAFADRSEACLPDLVGELALAAWDAAARRLVLARDPSGARPLFYAWTPGSNGERELRWASNLTALLPFVDDRRLDEQWIAGFLIGLPDPDRTVWRGIRQVPPGHLLRVDAAGESLRPWWPAGPIDELRLGDDAEYEERFLALLTEAVRCRLDAEGPVFVQLSGGVDSSSLACVADGLLRRRDGRRNGLQTASFVFDEAATSDERRFIRLVEDRIDRLGHHLSEVDLPFLAEGAADVEMPNRLTSFWARQNALATAARRAGSRVMLSGVGGDDLCWSEVPVASHLVEHLVRGRPLRLLRELRDLRRELDAPIGRVVWEGVLEPLLPAGVQARLGRRLLPDAPWIEPAFGRRTGLRRRLRGLLPGPERVLTNPRMRQHAASLLAMAAQQTCQRYQDVELLGYEMRYPFLHRPLVEFCLALPVDQLVRPGETRSLHRRALRHLLPPEVAWRRDKRGPEEAMMRAVGRHWPRLSELFRGDAHVYRHGFVRRDPLLAGLDRLRFGIGSASPLYRVIELELWLHRQPTVS